MEHEKTTAANNLEHQGERLFKSVLHAAISSNSEEALTSLNAALQFVNDNPEFFDTPGVIERLIKALIPTYESNPQATSASLKAILMLINDNPQIFEVVNTFMENMILQDQEEDLKFLEQYGTGSETYGENATAALSTDSDAVVETSTLNEELNMFADEEKISFNLDLGSLKSILESLNQSFAADPENTRLFVKGYLDANPILLDTFDEFLDNVSGLVEIADEDENNAEDVVDDSENTANVKYEEDKFETSEVETKAEAENKVEVETETKTEDKVEDQKLIESVTPPAMLNAFEQEKSQETLLIDLNDINVSTPPNEIFVQNETANDTEGLNEQLSQLTLTS